MVGRCRVAGVCALAMCVGFANACGEGDGGDGGVDAGTGGARSGTGGGSTGGRVSTGGRAGEPDSGEAGVAGSGGTTEPDASAGGTASGGSGDDGGDDAGVHCGAVDEPCCEGDTCGNDGCCHGPTGLCAPATGACVGTACGSVDCTVCTDTRLFRRVIETGTKAGTPVRATDVDVDDDGDVDFIVSHEDRTTLIGLINGGRGQFTQKEYVFDTAVWGVGGGDVNSDGKTDLVVSAPDKGSVLVLFNLGGGVFGTATEYPAGTTPLGGFVRDLDGDGRQDILVNTVEGVALLKNAGNGTFGAPTVVVPDVLALVVEDVNHDGRPDIGGLGQNDRRNGFVLFLNRPEGFESAYDLYVDRAHDLVMADFDADGEQDAAVVSGDRSHFLFGNGDGTFTESHEGGVEVPRSFVVRRAGRATPLLLASTSLYGFRDRVARVEHTFSYYWRNTVLVADVNGDGNTDLLARDAGGRLSVILATRDDLEFDGFRRGVEPPGPLPEALATGDMNGDGLSDIVAAHDGSIVISHAAPSGGFPDSVGHQTGLGATNGGDIIVLDDFDGDRSVDVAVPVRQVAGQSAISVLFNAGGDEWGATILSTTPGTPWGTWAFASGDLDRDGDEDLIATVQNESTGSVEFFENDGSGHFATPVPLFSVIAPSSVLVADFDANGIPDVAVATGSTSPSLLVFLATGNRTFAAPRTLALSGEGRSMIVEDLNGDGALDLVVASTRNGGPPYAEQGAMEVFINDRGGAFAPAVTYPCPLYSTVRAADWNADGWKDLAVVGQSHVIVFRNRHDGTFETLEDSFDLIGNAGGIAAIDFNRDGHLDLVTGPMSVALGHFDCGSQ